MTAGLGELAKVVEQSIPQGRGADPEEVARSVLFLASEDASFMTGHGKTATRVTRHALASPPTFG